MFDVGPGWLTAVLGFNRDEPVCRKCHRNLGLDDVGPLCNRCADQVDVSPIIGHDDR